MLSPLPKSLTNTHSTPNWTFIIFWWYNKNNGVVKRIHQREIVVSCVKLLGDFKVFSLREDEKRRGRSLFCLGLNEKSKCLMKCGNKIEKQKLNEADFVLKFYFQLFFLFFRFFRENFLEQFFGGGFYFPFMFVWFRFFQFYFFAFVSFNWMWKSKIIIFLFHWARLKTIAREKICNLWVKSESQKLRLLRDVIQFHMLELEFELLLWKAYDVQNIGVGSSGNRISGLTHSDLNGWPHFLHVTA